MTWRTTTIALGEHSYILGARTCIAGVVAIFGIFRRQCSCRLLSSLLIFRFVCSVFRSRSFFYFSHSYVSPDFVLTRQFIQLFKRYERLRVAVCDMCGDSSTAQSLPANLRTLARDLFPSMYDQYHLAVSSSLKKK